MIFWATIERESDQGVTMLTAMVCTRIFQVLTAFDEHGQTVTLTDKERAEAMRQAVNHCSQV